MNRLYQKPAELLTLEDEGDDDDGVVLVLNIIQCSVVDDCKE
jgi:hypothetical protein